MRNKNNYQLVTLLFFFHLTACSTSDQPVSSVTNCDKAPESSNENSALKAENETLKAEILKLQTEKEELIASATILLSSVQSEVNNNDLGKSEIALKRLVEKFPNTEESKSGKKLVNALANKLLAAEQESYRIAALGFKSLKITPSFSNGDLSLKLTNTSISMKWKFDDYGTEYSYREPEKDSKFITAQVTVSAKSKNPSLFGVGAYIENNGNLSLAGKFEYRFVRWDDYSSYIGNTADFRNDFAHSSTIPFTIGVSIISDELNKPIYLVVTKEGCNTRYDREFSQPPVSYSSYECNSLKERLTTDDFRDGSLAVLKRVN